MRIKRKHLSDAFLRWDGESGGGSAPQTSPAPAADAAPAGKTFTEDYVKTLRDESSGYKTTAKAYESALRKAFGLKDSEELGDVGERLTSYQQAQQRQIDDALSTANQRLIKAEIKSIAGYDHKLLEKVIDQSNIKVDENGTVTGLKEAVEAAAKDFPAVKIAGKKPPYVPQNPAQNVPNDAGEITKEKFAKMKYLDGVKLKQEHPEIYEKVKE